MTGVLVLLATLVLAGIAGLVMRARNGRMRAAPNQPANISSAEMGSPAVDPAALGLASMGLELGERATLLQFSSTFCAPCRATRTLLSDVAGQVPGVRHHDVDVAAGDAALELVRKLDIRRTPTTLVLDAEAREVRRASGVPRREHVLAALAEAAEVQA
jgi:thiol-disulfide isomerase/thioredoxin